MTSRRAVLGGMGGTLAALALPGAAFPRALSSAPRLRAGDTVGLIAPASSDDDPAHLAAALANVKGMGLVPRVGAHVSDIVGYLSGTDKDRAADIHAMFVEDVGEAEYRIDRMLTQLALAGVLGKLSGVVFGQCVRCASGVPNYAGYTVADILGQHLGTLGIPAFSGANIGHVYNQLSLPVGAQVEMDADQGTIRLLHPIVA